MPKLLRLFPTGPVWPYDFSLLRRDEPWLSVSDAPHPGEIASWLTLSPPIVIIQPQPTEPPEHDPALQEAVETTPVEQDGQWFQAWELQNRPPTPPLPDWLSFKTAMLTSAEVNAAMGAAMPSAPLAVMSLPAALNSAVFGTTSDFAVTWTTLRQAGLIPQTVLDAVAATAVACHLPAEFVQVLGGTL
jgi:hypothetical protein